MKSIRISFCYLLLSFCMSCTVRQPKELYLVSSDNGDITQYEYVDDKGKVIIPSGKYGVCYTDTIKTIGFVLAKDDGIIAIDKSGKKLFNVFTYDNGPDYIKEGLFRITNSEHKIGFADMNGNIIIKPQFKFAYPFNDSRAIYCEGGRDEFDGNINVIVGAKWGFVDKKGNKIINAKFDYIKSFNNGMAAFCIEENSDDKKWGFIDTNGNIAIKPIFDNVSTYDYDSTMVIYKGEKHKLSEIVLNK